MIAAVIDNLIRRRPLALAFSEQCGTINNLSRWYAGASIEFETNKGKIENVENDVVQDLQSMYGANRNIVNCLTNERQSS